MLHLYEIDDGGEQWWIAHTSAEAALEVGRTTYCLEDGLDDDDELTAEQVDDEKLLTVGTEDPWGCDPPEGVEVIGEGDRPSWRATAAAWAQWAGEGGLVGSTLF